MIKIRSKRLSDFLRIFSYPLIALGYVLLGVYQSLLIVIPTDIASDAPDKYPRNMTVTIERDRYALAMRIGKDVSDKMPNLVIPALLLASGYYLNKISNKKAQ